MQERIERMPKTVLLSILEHLNKERNGNTVADIVSAYSREDAVEIIDNLDESRARAVLALIYADAGRKKDAHARSIVLMAMEEKIRGSVVLDTLLSSAVH